MNSLKNNKFSLILATKNSINNLKKTLRSIKSQNYKNYELIVIDGKSNDGTEEYLKNEKKNMNLIYKSEPDEGMLQAYDKGWNLASGDIVSTIATDERLFDDNVLKNINDQFNLHKNKFFLVGNTGFMNQEEEIIEISKPFGGNIDNMKFDLISHLSCETVLPMHSTFFKKDRIKDIKFDLNVKTCGDYFYLANLLSKYNYKDFIYFDRPVLKAIRTRISASYRSENYDNIIQTKISSLEKFCKLNKDIINQNKLNHIKSGIYMWAVEQISVMDNLSSQCLNYLNLAIKYNRKYKRILKFIKFHEIEFNEDRFILEDNISKNNIKKIDLNCHILIKNHHIFLKKFFFRFKKKEFYFNTESYGKLLDIEIRDKNNNLDFSRKNYWVMFDIFLIKGRIAISKFCEKNDLGPSKEKYFINENSNLKVFYKLNNYNDFNFRIRNFGEFRSRFVLNDISLYYND